MYEIDPAEWGPARHYPESPQSHLAIEAFRDLRDADQRPDDN